MLEEYYDYPNRFEFCTEDYGWYNTEPKTLQELVEKMSKRGWFLFGSAVPKVDGVVAGYTATFIKRKDWKKPHE